MLTGTYDQDPAILHPGQRGSGQAEGLIPPACSMHHVRWLMHVGVGHGKYVVSRQASDRSLPQDEQGLHQVLRFCGLGCGRFSRVRGVGI